MAATMKCFFHTSRDALIRCKQCGKPLCHECRMNTDMGVFCSQECYEKTKNFTERAAQHSQKKSSYWLISSIVRKLVGLIVVIGVIWGLWKFGPEPVSSAIDNAISFVTNLF